MSDAHTILLLGFLVLLLAALGPLLLDGPSHTTTTAPQAKLGADCHSRPSIVVVTLCGENYNEHERKRDAASAALHGPASYICVPAPIRLIQTLSLVVASIPATGAPEQEFDYLLVVFDHGTALMPLVPSSSSSSSEATSNITLTFVGSSTSPSLKASLVSISRVPCLVCSGSSASLQVCRELVQDFLMQKMRQTHAPATSLSSLPVHLHVVLAAESAAEAVDPATFALFQYYSNYLYRLISDSHSHNHEGGDGRIAVTTNIIPRLSWPGSGGNHNQDFTRHHYLLKACPSSLSLVLAAEKITASSLCWRQQEGDGLREEWSTGECSNIVLVLYASNMNASRRQNPPQMVVNSLATSKGSVIELSASLSTAHRSQADTRALVLSTRDAIVKNLYHHLGLEQHFAGMGTFRVNVDSPKDLLNYSHSALPMCWCRLLRHWASLAAAPSQTHSSLTRCKAMLDGAAVGSAAVGSAVIWAAMGAAIEEHLARAPWLSWPLWASRALQPPQSGSSGQDERRQVMLLVPDDALWRAHAKGAVLLDLLGLGPAPFCAQNTSVQDIQRISQYLSHHPTLLSRSFSAMQTLTIYCPFFLPLFIPLLRGFFRTY